MPNARPLRARLAVFSTLLCTALPPGVAAAAAAAGDLPRYDLKVGRVLSYSSESKAVRPDGKPGTEARAHATATVVAENPDGSRRVVVRNVYRYGDSDERVTVGAVDVFPDGRSKPVGRPKPGFGGAGLFPLLPPDAAAAAGKWAYEPDWTGSVTTYSPAPSPGSADEFAFTAVREGPIDRIYESASKSTIRFDKRKGIVVASEDEHSQGYGITQTSKGRQALDKDEMIDSARAAALGAAYEKLFAAEEKHIELLTRINEEPENAAELVGEAKAALERPAKDVSDPEVSKEFTRLIKQHDDYAKYSLDEAKRVAQKLNKPAHLWQAKDLDGKTWSQADLKGKVVVMDFWYRGCGWCIYAMPQVKQLAADYKDKGVVVLGMNTDRKLDDARFVVKELGLDYPQIQAGELPAHFGVRAFPSLLVIDQQGVVRLFHAGYSPDLREKLGKHIDELLRKHPA